MPYIAPIPAVVDPTMGGTAIKYPGVLAGQTNGTIVTFDHSPPLANIALQLSAIQSALNGGPGGADGAIPGSLLALLNSSQQSLAAIDISLRNLRKDGLDSLLATTDQTNSVQQSLSTIAGLMAVDLSLKTMALADQIKHNQFVQTTTNVTRQESGKEDIVVQPENFQKQVTGAGKDMLSISAQAYSGSGILSGITAASTTALSISKGWLADTEIGKDIIKRVTKWQAQGKTYLAEQESQYKKAVTGATTRATKAGGAAAAGTSPTDVPDTK